jgi:hypothetical protein
VLCPYFLTALLHCFAAVKSGGEPPHSKRKRALRRKSPLTNPAD